MPFILLAILIMAIVAGPSLWVRWVLSRHGADRSDFPGTGGELARHLLDQFDLDEIAVEATDQGDHYDPTGKAVRLRPEHYDGRSLTAVTVAAHEVGHALQDSDGYLPLTARTKMARAGRRKKKPRVNLRLEYFKPLFRREIPVVVHTQAYQVVQSTLRILHDEMNLRVVIDHGTFDSYKISDHAHFPHAHRAEKRSVDPTRQRHPHPRRLPPGRTRRPPA